jgi:hypothetical protein
MFEPIYYEDFDPKNIEIASIDRRTYSEGNITFYSISLKYVSGTMERKFFLMGLPVFTCLGIKRKNFEKETQNESGKYSLAVKFESSNSEHREFAKKWLKIMQRIEQLIKGAYESGKDQNVLSKLVSKVKQQGGTTLLVTIKDPIKLFYNQNEQTDDYDIEKINDKTLYFKLDRDFRASVIYKDEKDQPKNIHIKDIEQLKNVSFTASLIITFNWIYVGSTITSLVTNVKHAYIYEITEPFTIPSFVKENANRLNIMSEEELQRVLPEKVEKLSLEEDNEETVTVEKIKTLEKDGRRTNEERKPEEKSKDYEGERSEERKNRERRSDEKGSKEKSKRSEEKSRKNIQVITNMDDIIPTENDENEE